MNEIQSLRFRFNLRTWLHNVPFDKRNAVIQKICIESGQSKHTIKRIMYMKPEESFYVRPETKLAICKIFGKDISELESIQQPDQIPFIINP